MRNFCYALSVVLILSTSRSYGSEAGMPQLNPEFWAAQVFWLILIFSILYIVIWKIFLPKITYSIENRKSKIVDDVHEAQKLKENVEKKILEYDQIINNSKKEAKKIIEASRKKLDRNIEEKKKKFADEIEKELAVAEAEAVNLKKDSEKSIKKIAVEMSAEIVKKIIGAEVNSSNVSAIVDEVTKRKVEKRT